MVWRIKEDGSEVWIEPGVKFPPEDDGWIPYDGKGPPMDIQDEVIVKFRDGSTCENWNKSILWTWEWMGDTLDIVAYKVRRGVYATLETFPDALEEQVGGDHYKSLAISPIKFILANGLNYVHGNVVKYICRADKKGKAEDLKKLIHYIRMELQEEYGIRSKVEYSE